MKEMRTMNMDEEFALRMKAIELEKQGKIQEAKQVRNRIPMVPYLAKFYKDHLGLEALLKTGWNLSEAEAEYGPGWLSR